MNDGDQPTSTASAEITKTVVKKEGDTTIKTQTVVTDTERERIAVVKASPRRWWQSITAKMTGLVVGNGLFLWLWGQIELYRSFELPLYVHLSVAGTVLFISLIWIGNEIYSAHKWNKEQKEIDELLVNQNSTADNLAQLIPAEQVELYRLRGFKIITRGDPKVSAGPVPESPQSSVSLPQGQ